MIPLHPPALALPAPQDRADRPLFDLPALGGKPLYEAALGSGLVLRIERDELGWTAGVFRPGHKDNLLYPQRRWHGAWPCQLSAWSHRRKYFPDLRILPIRGHRGAVVIDLSQAFSAGEQDHEVFTGGRIRVAFRAGGKVVP